MPGFYQLKSDIAQPPLYQEVFGHTLLELARKNEKIVQPQVNFKKGLKSETRTLQAFLLISIAMLVIWLLKNKMI